MPRQPDPTEDLVPALSAALAALHRAPGSNLRWVDEVVRKLHASRMEDYHQVRRVNGLGQAIANLTRLDDGERGALTLGLFMVGLLGDVPDPGQNESPAWTDYLLRESWVEPALSIARFIRYGPSQDEQPPLAALVADAAWALDAAAVQRTSSTLDVLKALRAGASTPPMERLVECLWSEAGQEICDLHGRQGGQTYQLEAADIREAIETLRKVAPAVEPPVERAVAPPPPAAAPRLERPAKAAAPPSAPAASTSANFERRKQAVVVAGSLRDVFQSTPMTSTGITAPTRATAIKDAATEPAAAGEDGPVVRDGGTATPVKMQTPVDEPAPALKPPPPAPPPTIEREEDVMTIDSQSRARAAANAPDMLRSLEDLRARLAEIERLASEGQQLLSAIQPSITELTAMLGQFESILGRWKQTERAA